MDSFDENSRRNYPYYTIHVVLRSRSYFKVKVHILFLTLLETFFIAYFKLCVTFALNLNVTFAVKTSAFADVFQAEK